MIHSIRKQHFCGIGPLHVEDKTLTNSQDMADALNLFASVFTHEDLSSWPYLNELDSSFPDMHASYTYSPTWSLVSRGKKKKGLATRDYMELNSFFQD